MKFYPFHIGDYASHTAHLNPIEDIAYRRCLDWYYLHEKPLPLDLADIARLIEMSDQADAVSYVVTKFFFASSDGWKNKRADIEIAAHHKAKQNHWTKRLTKPERAAMENERRAKKLQATPKWLSKSDRDEIAKIYAEAAMMTASTGIPHEVDHIIPLRNEKVCGLHVAWNLRVITAEKNRRKSNFLEVA